MSKERRKIILSTDIGSDVDDALSLLAMLNHPEINLEGIYTVNGDVDSRSRIAKHIVDLSGNNISRADQQALKELFGLDNPSDPESSVVTF